MAPGVSPLTFLPFLGGAFSIFFMTWFLFKKGSPPSTTKRYFITYLLFTGLYGMLETVAYLTPYPGAAKIVLIASRVDLLLAAYAAFSFASSLSGDKESPKTAIIPTVFLAAIVSGYLITDIRPAPWGWKMVFFKPVLAIYVFGLVLFAVLVLFLLYEIYSEIKPAETPYAKRLRLIISSLALTMAIGLTTNALFAFFEIDIIPMLSILTPVPVSLLYLSFRETMRRNGV